MRTRELERLRETAHHEAGHAVASWWLGVKFKYVTVTPAAGSSGHLKPRYPKWVQPDADSSDRVRLHIERCIIIVFAGQLAEAKFRGKRPRYGMHGDNRQAVDMASYRGGSTKTIEAYLRYCWCASEDLVSMRWCEIQAVAGALLERKTISYEEVIEVTLPVARRGE
jgi:hypothetical protein